MKDVSSKDHVTTLKDVSSEDHMTTLKDVPRAKVKDYMTSHAT